MSHCHNPGPCADKLIDAECGKLGSCPFINNSVVDKPIASTRVRWTPQVWRLLLVLVMLSNIGVFGLATVVTMYKLQRTSDMQQFKRHVTCYTNGAIMYDHDVYDPRFIGNSVEVYDPELENRIILTGDFILTK